MKLQVRIIEHSRCVSNNRHEELLAEKLRDLEDYQVKFITDNGNSYTVFYSKDSSKPLMRKEDHEQIYLTRKQLLNKEHSIDMGTINIDPKNVNAEIVREWIEKAEPKEKPKKETFQERQYKEAEKNEMFARFGIRDIEDPEERRKYIGLLRKSVGDYINENFNTGKVTMDREDIALAVSYLYDYKNFMLTINPLRTSHISELIVRLQKQMSNGNGNNHQTEHEKWIEKQDELD